MARFRLVDLSHPFSIHTPGWAGYPPVKVYYIQRFSSNEIVAQMIETPLHVSTHLDGQMHGIPGGKDIASFPLSRCFGEGVIVDISDAVGDWDVIRPQHITSRAEVRKGDILIYHTGYHHYYVGEREEDEARYFLRHPGGGREMAEWISEMEFAWTGVDCGSADHPMNTTIRRMRPDLVAEYERAKGVRLEEQFPAKDIFPMHRVPFKKEIQHVENVGGDLDQVLNRRCLIGVFPWRFEGGESSIARVVAFVEE
ncbi:MAG: cyclase family protein [Chloroflexi bacterium]|nr:cyclase family protein [Chloroflexota bacterium]